MKRAASILIFGSVAALLTLLAGCAKEVDRREPPAERVSARFDPTATDPQCNIAPVLPTPTDLARNAQSGLLELPTDGVGAAQAELNGYLSSLDGYPTTASAMVQFSGELDDDSIENLDKAITVLQVFESDDDEPKVEAVAAKELALSYSFDEGTGIATVTIRHSSGWQRATRYVLLVGKGLADKQGRAVTRSAVFEMVALTNPICELDAEDKCDHNYSALLASIVKRAVHVCENADGSKSSEEVDKLVEARLLESATALERLRQAHNALLELGKQFAEVEPSEVVVAWSFTTTSMVEAVFDPAARKIPGPSNDLLIATKEDTANACTKDHVCLTAPEKESAAAKALRLEVNKLDGFSTTAPSWAAFSAGIDPKSLDDKAALLINTEVPSDLVPIQLSYRAADNMVVVTPTSPLKESTRYAVVLLSKLQAGQRKAASGLTDQRGWRVVPSTTFALARMSAALVDKDGKSTLSLLDDASAAALEGLRLGLAPLLDALSKASIERQDVVVAWTFRTQTISATASDLSAVPHQVFDTTPPLFEGALLPNADPDKIPTVASDAIAQWVKEGRYESCTSDRTKKWVPMMMTVPTGPAPAEGWPSAVFLHGLGVGKEDMLAVANELAKQQIVTIAFDAPLSNEAFFDLSDPAAVRDLLHQVVIDTVSLLLAVKGGAPAIELDPDKIHVLGHSLGAMVGSIVLAVDSIAKRAVLAEAGGPWVVGIADSSATFAAAISQALKDHGYEAGSIEALRLTTTLQWILDPVDPVNFARFVTGQTDDDRLKDRAGAAITKKEAIQLLGAADSTVRLAAQQYLAHALGVDTSDTTYKSQKHGFLLSPSPSSNASAAAQKQAATFLGTGQICKPNVNTGTCEL